MIFEEGVLVFHPETIEIGSNVYIGHNTILKGYHHNKMQIGDNTWIGQCCFFHSAGGLKIGRSVGIGPMTKILTSTHEAGNVAIPILEHPLVFDRVVLEEGSDIGIASIILPGVCVGKGAVIGAGSVVTKNVSPYCVVAGSPAKFLRKRGDSF